MILCYWLSVQEVYKILFDKLNDWCSRWSMHINSTKTIVVHYRPKRINRTSFKFRCGEQSINVFTKYKYLCLWFTTDLDFSCL